MKNNVNLLEGSIPKAMVKLFIPQLFGFFAVVAFNFADSWFVSQLDDSLPENAESLYLSSFSMTFPVVFAIGSIAIGLGIAVTTLISRAYGAGNRDLAKRITRDSLILVVIFTLIVTVAGLMTIEPLFEFMGARPEQLPLIRDYMVIWYSGAVFMLIPMTCNNAMRGYGNTMWPGIIMMTGAGLNIIIDPILIFGVWFVPGMGVKGAAVATVLSRIVTAVISVSLVIKWNLIAISKPRFEEMMHEWKEMLMYALPGIAGKISLPVGIFGVTMVAAELGKNAVAAINAGGKIEQLILLTAMALSMVLMIFVSQNLAAGKKERAREAINWAYKSIAAFTLVCVLIIVLLADHISVWFNNITGVQDMMIYYLMVMPVCYVFISLCMMSQQCFFAVKKPMFSGMTDILRFIIVMIPAAWTGAYLYGYAGLVIALMIGHVVSALITVMLFEYQFRRYRIDS